MVTATTSSTTNRKLQLIHLLTTITTTHTNTNTTTTIC